MIFGVSILETGVFHNQNLFLKLTTGRRFLHKKTSPGQGIPLGAVHQCGECGGSRGEELDMFGVESQLPLREAAEGFHIRLCTAGMGGDEVAREKLFLVCICRKFAKEVAAHEQ